MHDEFSALFRTRFDSLDEVLKIGVQIGDTHPAGVQVFLWWLVGLVGENEFLLKLPFVFMGILSIPLVYKIGSLWFNRNVGLLVAAYIATIQYTLTYSVIIRPYISGLFLGLMMVYFWTLIIKGNKGLLVHVGYVVFSVLCAYNHHFSLLFAFVVGVSGLFIIDKKELWKYLLTGISIFILYVPHLSILFYQLDKGGLDGWLRAPSLLFPIHYLEYIFHFSVGNYLTVLFVFFLSLFYGWNKKRTVFYNLSIIWFLFPLVIGLLYSITVSPVIQYSMLIFTVPFLLFAILGMYPENISRRLTAFLVVLILAVNVFTLVSNRQHYRVLYQTRHLAYLNDINTFKEKSNSTILIANHPRINDYYQEEYSWEFEYVNYLYGVSNNIGLIEVEKMVGQSKSPFFVYAGMSIADPEIIQIIKKAFPYCIEKKDYYASGFYVFSKSSKKSDTLKAYFEIKNEFKSRQDNWTNVDLEYVVDGAVLSKQKEWGPHTKFNLDSVLVHKNDVLDINVRYTSKSEESLYLVTEVKYKDSVLHYSAVSSNQFLKEKDTGSIYKTIEFSGLPFTDKDVEVSSYLWNKEHGDFVLNEFSLKLRRGNPLQYSLYEPILENYE